MSKRFLIAFCVAISSGIARAQVAYISRNQLYVLPTNASGHATRDAFRVCSVEGFRLFGTHLSWMPDGRVVIESDDVIWSVAAKPNSRLHKLVDGSGPSFSPGGRFMVYECKREAFILDLVKRTKRKIASRVKAAILSPTGAYIAILRLDDVDGNIDDCHLELFSFPGGRLIHKESRVAGWDLKNLSVSPDGATLTFEDWPTMPGGAQFYSTKSGFRDLLTKPDEVFTFGSWPNHGRRILIETGDHLKTAFHESKGWIRTYVTLTTAGSKRGPRRLDIGGFPQYSTDATEALYLTDGVNGAVHPFEEDSPPLSLVRRPVRGHSRHHILARNVKVFAVKRNPVSARTFWYY